MVLVCQQFFIEIVLLLDQVGMLDVKIRTFTIFIYLLLLFCTCRGDVKSLLGILSLLQILDWGVIIVENGCEQSALTYLELIAATKQRSFEDLQSDNYKYDKSKSVVINLENLVNLVAGVANLLPPISLGVSSLLVTINMNQNADHTSIPTKVNFTCAWGGKAP